MKMVSQKHSPVSLVQIPHDAEFVRTAVIDALKTADLAAQKMILCGQVFREIKAAVGHNNWLKWLDKNVPEISEDRAERWMKAAANVIQFLELPVIDIPMSQVLSLPDAELSAPAREAKQLFFDFTSDKTITDCIRCVFEGDEPHRITRAHNGKTKGGTRGENRKDWPLYFGENLNGALAHAKHWTAFSAAQKHEAEALTKLFFGAAPAELIEFMADSLGQELKDRKKGKLQDASPFEFALDAARKKRKKEIEEKS